MKQAVSGEYNITSLPSGGGGVLSIQRIQEKKGKKKKSKKKIVRGGKEIQTYKCGGGGKRKKILVYIIEYTPLGCLDNYVQYFTIALSWINFRLMHIA